MWAFPINSKHVQGKEQEVLKIVPMMQCDRIYKLSSLYPGCP